MFSVASTPNRFLKYLLQKEQKTSNLKRTEKVIRGLDEIGNEPALEPTTGCCDRGLSGIF